MLGRRATDRITGFSGIITAKVDYLNGCSQALVSPPVDERGDIREGGWFDVERLEIGEVAILTNSFTPGRD